MLTGFAIGCVSVLIIIFARDLRKDPVVQIFILMMVLSIAYLINPLVDRQLAWITECLQVGLPALFWFLCFKTFADKAPFFSFWLSLALCSFLAPGLTRVVWFFWPDASIFDETDSLAHLRVYVTWTLSGYFEYLLIANGIWLIVSNYNNDLVESRRQLRVLALIVVALATLFGVLSEKFGWGGGYAPGIIMTVSALLIAYFSLRGNAQIIHSVRQKEVISPAAGEATVFQQRLMDIMDEGFYRKEKLTLKILANELGKPEYKIRMIINQELGFKNFNDYINSYRIKDAAKRLMDEPDTPILNISLDVGYRSLSSFNRAFKDRMETTPTQYRAELQTS